MRLRIHGGPIVKKTVSPSETSTSMRGASDAPSTCGSRLPKSAGQGVQHLDIQLQASDDPSIRKIIKAKAMMPIEFGKQ